MKNKRQGRRYENISDDGFDKAPMGGKTRQKLIQGTRNAEPLYYIITIIKNANFYFNIFKRKTLRRIFGPWIQL